MRNFGKGAKWVPGGIIGTVSPRNYDVQVGDTLCKRHEEQLRPRLIPTTQYSELVSEPQVPESMDMSTSVRDGMPSTTSRPVTTRETEVSIPIPIVDTPAINPEPYDTPKPQHLFTQHSNPSTPPPEKPERRYPLRDRKPPQKLY